MGKVVYPAKLDDWQQIKSFAKKAGVDIGQAEEDVQFLLMVDKAEQIDAIIGVDLKSPNAMLRSLVIDSAKCNGGELFYLLEVALAYAKEQRITAVYFATLASVDMFSTLGFEEIPFHQLPGEWQEAFEGQARTYPQSTTFLKCQWNEL